MASFTPEQKAFIREVVFEAAPIIVESHVHNCPWGKKVSRLFWIGIGIGIGLSLLGITTIPDLVAWVGHTSKP